MSRSSASRTTAGTVARPGLARGAPAALAGDQLVAALRAAAARRPAGSGPARLIESASPRRRLAVEPPARLPRVRVDRRRPASCASSAAASPPIRTSKPRPRPRRSRRARQAPSPPSSRPRRRASAGRSGSTGRPWLGASARRTERGTTASKTSAPKCLRTSASTSAESRVRASAIVSRTPPIASLGLSRALDQVDRLHELREALERVVLGLHRHDHPVGGGERVHRQRAERRRAVEEDEVEAVARRASASAR